MSMTMSVTPCATVSGETVVMLGAANAVPDVARRSANASVNASVNAVAALSA